VLDHIDEVSEHTTKTFSMRISHHLQFSHVRGAVNKDQEKRRDSVRAVTPKLQPHRIAQSSLFATQPPTNLGFAASGTSENRIFENSGGLRTPTLNARRPSFDVLNLNLGSGTGPGLVLVHGLRSSEGTWTSYMADQMTNGGGFENAYGLFIPSLSSLDHLESQVSDLRDRVTQNTVGAPSTIYIGHSQGGLIARRLGQEYPSLVGGVITIGTPNVGAPILNNTESAIGNAIGGAVFAAEVQLCNNNPNRILCPIVTRTMPAIFTNLVHFGVSAAAPATADLTVGSSFLATSQQAYEGFRRASIAHNARNPWRLARLAGDAWGGCDASGLCAGRSWASKAEIGYKAISSCSFLGHIFSFLRGAGNVCGAARDAMNGAETALDRLVSNKQESDAVVPVWSQHYPGNPGTYQAQRFRIADGDSHLGETRSRWTRDALVNQALPVVFAH
jgi:pimeloyl-ACP methyl ester carboxylesterase